MWPPMKMTERQVGDVTILDLRGTITLNEDVARLKDRIDGLILQQRTSVVLNLAEISYIDSCGLGQLATSCVTLGKTGGALKLLHVSKRNQHLLSITRLVLILEAFDSEDEVLRSFETLSRESADAVVA